MSESQKESGGQPQQASGGSVGDSTTSKQSNTGGDANLVKYETYKKAVDREKAAISELQELRAKIDTLEADKLAAEGNKDQLIDKLKAQVDDLNKKVKNTNQTYAYKTVTSQLEKAALAKGCRPDATDKLIKLLDLSSIQVDDEFQVRAEDVTALIEEAQKSMPYFFGTKAPVISDGNPSNNPINSDIKKGLKGLKKEDLLALWAKVN